MQYSEDGVFQIVPRTRQTTTDYNIVKIAFWRALNLRPPKGESERPVKYGSWKKAGNICR